MNSLTSEIAIARAQNVRVTSDTLFLELSDGRTVSVPLAWYPRLLHGTPEQRRNWRLIGAGEGIHWLDLDEDISVTSLVLGQPSSESQTSLKKWLKAHQGKVAKKAKAGEH